MRLFLFNGVVIVVGRILEFVRSCELKLIAGFSQYAYVCTYIKICVSVRVR